MPYQLNYPYWLNLQADRCEGILSQHLNPYLFYSVADLLSLCRDLGLTYTPAEYAEIGQLLIERGVLVSVPGD